MYVYIYKYAYRHAVISPIRKNSRSYIFLELTAHFSVMLYNKTQKFILFIVPLFLFFPKSIPHTHPMRPLLQLLKSCEHHFLVHAAKHGRHYEPTLPDFAAFDTPSSLKHFLWFPGHRISGFCPLHCHSSPFSFVGSFSSSQQKI